MAYCAQADILKRVSEDVLIQLTDLEGEESINSDVLSEAIARADAEIDSYLRVRGEDVPLTDTPNIVAQISIALTLADLYESREAMPETIKDRREWARQWLKDFAAGKVSLADDDHQGSDPASGVSYETETREFTHPKMKGW